MFDKILYKNGEFNRRLVLWGGLLFIMLVRSFYFGITYFNYLDDYNTYGVFFRRNGDIWNNIVLWYKLYTFRPIAFLCDAYITQWFWNSMWLVLLFYTVMHFATIYLFHWIFEKSNLRFGIFGILIAALTPILIEAVYWIGASTRLVPGMFFSVLSVFFLMKYVLSSESIFAKNPGRGYLVLYFLFNLISTGFYEQIVVFNLVFTFFIVAVNYDLLGRYDRFIASVPFISTFAIGLYYIIFWNHGKVQSRGQLAEGLVRQFINTTKGIANILVKQNYAVTADSLKGFLFMNINLLQILILAFVILFTIWVFIATIRRSSSLMSKNDSRYLLRLIMGVMLTIAPFGPFYILKNNYMSFRAVYPSIFGIAIFLDTILDMLSEIKIGRFSLFIIKPVVTAVVIIPFFMAGAGWINDYRLVEVADNIIMDNFLEAFSKTGKSDESPVLFFNSQLLYARTSSDRFENVSSSDWAMLGKANSDSGEYYFKNILPVRQDETLINNDLISVDTALLAIDENMDVFELYLENNLLYKKENNLVYGKIIEMDSEYSVFELMN